LWIRKSPTIFKKFLFRGSSSSLSREKISTLLLKRNEVNIGQMLQRSNIMGCDASRLSWERRALLYVAVPQRQNARQFRATYARFKYCYILHYYDSDGRIVLVLNKTFYMPRAFPACRGFHFSTRIMQNAPGKSRRTCIPLRHTRVTVWYYEILLSKTGKTGGVRVARGELMHDIFMVSKKKP